MAFLHSQDPPIIHCDLKANNVLVKLNIKILERVNEFQVFSDDGNCKITDFGIAQLGTKLLDSSAVYEAIAPPEENLSIYSDVFMYGLLLMEVITKFT